MLTGTQVQTAFKTFGKLIKLAQIGETFTDTLKEHQAATVDQAADASVEAYGIFKTVVVPLELSVGRTIAGVESVPLRAKQAVENYLMAIADQLGVSRSATTAAKLNALKTSMIAEDETIPPSGGGNTDGFYSFFFDRWGVTLPTDSPASLPDEWITTTIVE